MEIGKSRPEPSSSCEAQSDPKRFCLIVGGRWSLYQRERRHNPDLRERDPMDVALERVADLFRLDYRREELL